MLSKYSKICSHFKPMSAQPYSCSKTDCAHCEYYCKTGCHKNYYDTIEESDGEL